MILLLYLHTLHSLTNVPSTLCYFWRGLPNPSYNTCQLKRGCWSGYSPPHPYVRTHPDLARLYNTDRSMERTHSGDKPKAPTGIGIQHQPRDVPIARYSTPAERCSYEASTSTDVPWCWPRQLDRHVVPSHDIQIPKVEPTDRLSAPPQRESCANKTRIPLVFLSWEFPQPTILERQLGHNYRYIVWLLIYFVHSITLLYIKP